MVSMISLSLSLVEVVAEAQRGVVVVAGVVLPPQVTRDHWWTATQLSAISISGTIPSASSQYDFSDSFVGGGGSGGTAEVGDRDWWY